MGGVLQAPQQVVSGNNVIQMQEIVYNLTLFGVRYKQIVKFKV